MKIDVPFEVGDPILVIACDQRDGYYINCRPFRWSDIPDVGKCVFGTRKEAEKALADLQVKEYPRK